MPLLAGLVLCLVAVPCQQEKSVFDQVCSNPTGKNGYEEYLRACDAFLTQVGDEYWNESQKVLPGDLGWLNAQRALVTRGSQAIEWVRAGNDKPVSDPRASYDAKTTVPELVHFKNLSRIFVIKANVQFADGQPRDAVRTLESGLRFSGNVQGTGILINYLVGIAMQSIVLKGFSDNLARLPLPDLERLSRGPIGSTDSKTAKLCLETENVMMQAMFDGLITDRNGLDGFVSGFESSDDDKTVARLKSMPAAEFVKVVQEAKESTRARIKEIEAILDSPESRWNGLVARLDHETSANESPASLLASNLAIGTQVLTAELKRRTQLRLIRVHVLVRRYRLLANKLPDSLDRLGDQNVTVDPLTGKPYVYEVNGDGYQLYSRGNEQTGRIDLVYRKDLKAGGPEEAVIRP